MEITRAKGEIDDISDSRNKNRRTFLRSQVGIGSESDCLFGQLDRILDISDSVAGLRSYRYFTFECVIPKVEVMEVSLNLEVDT